MLKVALKFVIGLVLVVLLILLFGLTPSQQFSEIAPREKQTSERGLYVTRYVAQTPSFFNYIINQ